MELINTELNRIEEVINFLVGYLAKTPDVQTTLSNTLHEKHLTIFTALVSKTLLEKGLMPILKLQDINNLEVLELIQNKMKGSLEDEEILQILKESNSIFCKSVIADMQNTVPDKSFLEFYNYLEKAGIILNS